MAQGDAEKNENRKWLIRPSETSAFNEWMQKGGIKGAWKQAAREMKGKMEQDIDNINDTKRPKQNEKCPLDWN